MRNKISKCTGIVTVWVRYRLRPKSSIHEIWRSMDHHQWNRQFYGTQTRFVLEILKKVTTGRMYL